MVNSDKDPYRLVVCIDVDADSLTEAYGKVYEALAHLPADMTWESSDESYDDEGAPVDERELAVARAAYLSSKLE